MLAQLVAAYRELGTPILALMRVSRERISRYGVATIAESRGRLLQIAHVLRYAPFFVELRETVASGRLGARDVTISADTLRLQAGFAERGGVIRFTLEDNRVRFEVNVDAAHQADLNISSRLLTLAKIIPQTAASGRNPG